MNRTKLLVNLPIEEYHKSDAISWSKLRVFAETAEYHGPSVFKAKFVDKTLVEPEEYKDHFRLGHAFEDLLTESGKTIDVLTYENWRLKAASQAFDESLKNKRIPVLTHEMEMLKAMVKAVHENSVARQLLAEPVYQASFRYAVNDKVTLQCRPDILTHDSENRVIDCDIKTTSNIDDFARSARWLDYPGAGVFYRAIIAAWNRENGVEDCDVVRKFLVVEKTKTPRCVVFGLSDATLDDAQRRIFGDDTTPGALPSLLDCLKSGKWPTPDEENTLNIIHKTPIA